jgi:LmbE family N-acetylglucosaminyl deacetylase
LGLFGVKLAAMATIVAFHAHPDDEVLLTGGTIARLAAEGHRVVIVVACDGDVWDGPDQGQRLDELRASAAILGAARAVHLGYADSGHGPVLFDDPPGRTRFARAHFGEAAGRLAALLAEEHADLLLSYDPQGGYGHRDHVRVHQVGARAGGVAGVRVVEATVPRELVARVARLLLLLRLVTRHRLDEMRGYGMPRSAITHRVDVRAHAARKRAALAARLRRCPGGGGLPGCSARCCGRPCRFSASSAGQSGSPSPGDERATSSPAIRPPDLAVRSLKTQRTSCWSRTARPPACATSRSSRSGA